MNGAVTSITNPDSPGETAKSFTFDYSYWSHDGFHEENGIYIRDPGSVYASQQSVYDDLGQSVLDNALEGYNCSLFAYGQTGSGKSYSMVGYGPNRGIVPITCDELFKVVEGNDNPNKRFEVTFSMLEIYNEQVRDLLSKEPPPKGGLPVRQNPKLGLFYVQGLKHVPVGSYADIEKRMEQGTASRTVASTNMNATSSRAHTVVTITFDQIIKDDAGETKKSSVMNLVDLAGSERAGSTGATGDRLKEGANINKSLASLGNVISALAEISGGTKKKIVVPYRDSVLTKLLQNALGGNSKTVMIAALSPADINYEETLSTLRYADRAKQIKTKAVVNESAVDKLLRELKEENERLKKLMEGGSGVASSLDMAPGSANVGMSSEEVEKMRHEMEEEIRAQLIANQEAIRLSSSTAWNRNLAAVNEEDAVEEESAERKKQKLPHLVNLNEDPLLSGVVFHYMEKGENLVGRKDGDFIPAVCLNGLSIMKNHAIINYISKHKVELSLASATSQVKVNGIAITESVYLSHMDRILFGTNHMYVFYNPRDKESASDGLPKTITWEFAQKEIAEAKGFDSNMTGLTKEQQDAQEKILELLPQISEVNAISEEMNKRYIFELVILSLPQNSTVKNSDTGHREYQLLNVLVRVRNLVTGNFWIWDPEKFGNRRFLIQEIYGSWLEGEDYDNIPEEEDPFWEPPEDGLIGTANVHLQNLSYGLDFDDKISIVDYAG